MSEPMLLASDGGRSVRLAAPELLAGWEVVSDLSPDRAVLLGPRGEVNQGSAVTVVICFVRPDPGAPELDAPSVDASLKAITLGRSMPVGTASPAVTDEVQIVPSVVEPVVQLTRTFRVREPDARCTVQASLSAPVGRLEEIAGVAQPLLDALEVV